MDDNGSGITALCIASPGKNRDSKSHTLTSVMFIRVT